MLHTQCIYGPLQYSSLSSQCSNFAKMNTRRSNPSLSRVGNKTFLHDRSWISPWIKSISNELDIVIHVIASQLPGHCDVIGYRLWRHQQNENWVSETRERCVKIVVLSSFMDSFCRVRNEIMYVLSWRTVSALTRVLFWCLFPSLLRNSGNKHQYNPLMSAETDCHSSIYIILSLYIYIYICKLTVWRLSFLFMLCHTGKYHNGAHLYQTCQRHCLSHPLWKWL